MKILLFYFFLTIFIGLFIIYLFSPEPIILIKHTKNMTNTHCLSDDNSTCFSQTYSVAL